MSPDATTAQQSAQTAAIDAVIRLVAAHFKLPLAELLGPSRAEPGVTIRQMAMKLARDLTGASYPDLAAAFGKDDHNTIRHACIVVDDKLRRDGVLRPAMIHLTAVARTEVAAIMNPAKP